MFHYFCSLACFLVLAVASNADSLKVLKEREKKVKGIVSRVMPSVVAVIGSGRGQSAAGSGVIINEDGLIMTAGHVTDAAGKELTIIFPDGRNVKGESLGINRTRDAGLARITEEGKWPYVKIGDSQKAKLGDWVVAMGHPGGYDLQRTPPIRLGRILSLGQMGMLGTDCTLVGGDSGGPLFNLDGEVIGIHSSIGGSLAENRHVPSVVYKKDWDRMLADERWGNLGMMSSGIDPDRPMLGVQMREDDSGVVVTGLLPNSPARRSGLKEGDIILEVDNMKAGAMSEVVDYVSSRKAGDEVELLILRGEEKRNFVVKLARWEDLAEEMGRGERNDRVPPDPVEERPQLGVVLDAEANVEGAKIHEVMEGSPAAAAGVIAGDIVKEIDGAQVGSAGEMAGLFNKYKAGQKLEVTISRAGEEKTLNIELTVP
ncbi:MAG: PDZ domain-containing protein [Verrucomicrobiales bacterium]|nr:PDZ domain-containing protein [Verrucomicrobiales bacterium]